MAHQEIRSRVAVVGGGMAGLAAVRTLCSGKFRANFDVKLLESSDRLGGRCRSEHLGNYPVEIGATFIHGTEGNVIHTLAQKYKLLDVGSARTRGYEGICKLSNGQDVSLTYFKCRKLFSTFERELTLDDNQAKWSREYENLYHYYRSRFFKAARDHGLVSPKNPDKSTSVLEAIFQNLMQYEGYVEGSSECRNVALCSSIDYDLLPGHAALRFPPPSCYSRLVDNLAAEIPKDTVHLNTEVHSIRWAAVDGSDGQWTPPVAPVQIVTNKGNFDVDHVIVTFPLGVLKSAMTEPCLFSDQPLFIPQLPESKQEAINGIGMDIINKLVVEFPESAIGEHIGWMYFSWLSEDRDGDVRIKEEFPWVRGLFSLQRMTDSNIFCGWLSGQSAVEAAQSSEEQLSSGVMYVLEKFLRKPIPASPTRIFTSHWEDKHIQGGYSFSTTDKSAAFRRVLSEPLGGPQSVKVLFAGEATHGKWYSTTHGAYDSGVREAERLIGLKHNIN